MLDHNILPFCFGRINFSPCKGFIDNSFHKDNLNMWSRAVFKDYSDYTGSHCFPLFDDMRLKWNRGFLRSENKRTLYKKKFVSLVPLYIWMIVQDILSIKFIDCSKSFCFFELFLVQLKISKSFKLQMIKKNSLESQLKKYFFLLDRPWPYSRKEIKMVIVSVDVIPPVAGLFKIYGFKRER